MAYLGRLRRRRLRIWQE